MQPAASAPRYLGNIVVGNGVLSPPATPGRAAISVDLARRDAVGDKLRCEKGLGGAPFPRSIGMGWRCSPRPRIAVMVPSPSTVALTRVAIPTHGKPPHGPLDAELVQPAQFGTLHRRGRPRGRISRAETVGIQGAYAPPLWPISTGSGMMDTFKPH